jgi:hypothetical protein
MIRVFNCAHAFFVLVCRFITYLIYLRWIYSSYIAVTLELYLTYYVAYR